MRKHWKEIIIYIIAAILLIVRVDFWWWGKKIYPFILGWITVPMIYQFLIWVAGFGLVSYICFSLWGKDPDEV
ncbi:MAG TPA: hypothetical protein PKW07_06835 [Syntrophorhabdaceae bacterium]|nr:hypothetical protein [Syntrophorhabdaceae bacterium]